MDPDLYRAAKNGEIEVFKQTKSELELHKLLTPDENTVLHIHITSLRTDGETSFVEEILNLCPALLLQPNAGGDIPLHVAARYGHDRLVKFLIDRAAKADHREDIESADVGDEKAAKEMLRTMNSVKETALHEAVRFGHIEVVRVLAEKDCVDQYGANDDGETPLYIAADRRYHEIVSLILEKCTSPAATGGPCGRTVLHAAVLMNSGGDILIKMGHLTKQQDARGWVPLHFAAKLNLREIIEKYLLSWDKDVGDAAYIKNNKGRTALHLAASKGHHEIMTKILSSRPDCGESVDNRRWNALHFAVKSNNVQAVNVILNDFSLSNLINGKDVEGNTPLHIATSLGYAEIQKALLSLSRSRVDKMSFNKKNKNAYDIAVTTTKNHFLLLKLLRAERVLSGNRIWIYEEEEDLKEFEENNDFNLDKAQKSTLVVATLIATMAFAAGFTLPGGYVGNDDGPLQGTAILRQKAAFQAFMITDTLAMVLSSASVLIQLFLSLREDMTRKLNYQTTAHFMTMISMGAMVIAFVTGTYAVLAPSVALAVASCVIGLSFFIFFYVLFCKAFGPF